MGRCSFIEPPRDRFPVDPFIFLIGLTYGLSVCLSWRRCATPDDHGWLVDLQFAADALVVSAFIHLTGGVTSYFSSLYVLPIIAASSVRSAAPPFRSRH
jgi:hypothetical protein